MSSQLTAASAAATEVPAITEVPAPAMVVSAINALYGSPDPKEKERASAWLESLKKSVFAWKVQKRQILITNYHFLSSVFIGTLD